MSTLKKIVENTLTFKERVSKVINSINHPFKNIKAKTIMVVFQIIVILLILITIGFYVFVQYELATGKFKIPDANLTAIMANTLDFIDHFGPFIGTFTGVLTALAAYFIDKNKQRKKDLEWNELLLL